MEVLRGMACLLACQTAGELLVRLLHLPFPGPVAGMLILLALLAVPAVRTPVGAAAEGLLAHFSLLFVPVGVGVVTHLDLLARYGARLLVVLLVSTWLGLAVTAALLRWALRRTREAA